MAETKISASQFFSNPVADTESVEVAPAPGGRISASQFFGGEPTASGAITGPAEAGGDAEDEGFVEGLLRDTAEGAVAPIMAAWSAGKAILSDPAIGVLPAEEQQADLAEAGSQTIKGAAFWGSMFVGGGAPKALGIAAKPLWKAVVAGGAAATTFEAIRKLPDLGDHTVSPGQYARDVATIGTFGALTGGVVANVPGATKMALKGANQLIDRVPGGAKLRDEMVKFGREATAGLWDKFFTSGQEVLRKAGLQPLATQLIKARDVAQITGGRLVAGFTANTMDLSDDEARLMGTILDQINFRKPIVAAEKKAIQDEFSQIAGPRFDQVWGKARTEAKRLRVMGLAMQRAGLKVFDPEGGEFHTFVLRDNYLPHRFVKPEHYRIGGTLREKALAVVQKEKRLEPDDAAVWLDNFADRLADEVGDFASGRTSKMGASHYLQGRVMSLPGYETDVRKVLPQYYEHMSKRLANHVMFGPTDVTEQAVRQEMLFDREQMSALVREDPKLLLDPKVYPEGAQLTIPFESTIGKGVKKTHLETVPKTLEETLNARSAAAQDELRKSMAIERRYPRAFAQLEAVPDGTLKKLATIITRRQLGAIEQVPFGEQTLNKLSGLEVVTKLALGAIGQPSQMLSTVMRTFYRGSIPRAVRAMWNDADSMDFATRCGAILKGLVRESEESLTGGKADFLKKVYFTQFDMKSRVFGAIQGRAYAEHVANKLTMLAKKFPVGQRDKDTQKLMARMEGKLTELGLDTAAIVQRGGYLTQKEMLQAGMRVSGEVNFWGDALSLPEFFRSPYGKYITQFKSFGFQQSRLIKEQMIKPALRGDWGPITRFAATMPLGGEMIADVKAMVRAKDPAERKDNAAERILENIANAAGFGLWYDAFEATRYGTSGSLGLMAGPIAGTAAKLHVAVGDALRGDPEKLARFGLETGLPAATSVVAPGALPAVAAATPALSNVVFPKRDQPK